MGTRGTLRVYLNGELKVRQYNQWDSYPTGQFMGICKFVKDPMLMKELTEKLSLSRFFTKEEFGSFMRKYTDNINDLMEFEENFYLASHILVQRNRDWGSNILYYLMAMPRLFWMEDTPYGILDWCMVFDYPNIEEEDAILQEGNYVINIIADVSGQPMFRKVDNIHFILSGSWHGMEREFPMDTIPTDAEIEAWEKEGYD